VNNPIRLLFRQTNKMSFLSEHVNAVLLENQQGDWDEFDHASVSSDGSLFAYEAYGKIEPDDEQQNPADAHPGEHVPLRCLFNY